MADAAQRFQNDDIYVHYQKKRSEVNSVSEQFVAEENRLEQSRAAEMPWKKWGPYLTERSGAPCVKITVRTAMPGIISAMTRRARVPIA